MEEYLNEEHRNEVEREFRQIRSPKKKISGKVYRPNVFTNFMRAFGQWMIARGEGLVKRYEVPSKKSKSSTQSYAH